MSINIHTFQMLIAVHGNYVGIGTTGFEFERFFASYGKPWGTIAKQKSK